MLSMFVDQTNLYSNTLVFQTITTSTLQLLYYTIRFYEFAFAAVQTYLGILINAMEGHF